ncbi:CesT family type III secretion system chaperone [Herbaspirillum sp. alder98]|uniref:CesT family type III secretion system chaperone n=1 Tax=Herbaspirillum sp. alder98 TaxID=2913096 RepID=UPI001CD87282|nr:CesT family type III secretion system chaperone [Herbaspirillum sp. alder98]MCA1325609.1 CesT family type III secretion system chaperone [Herbaspirillum sp. alder98]
MSKQLYEAVIRELCALSGIKDAQSIVNGGPVAVSEVVFSLHPGTDANEGDLLVYCDFGEIFKGREAEVSRTLLEANLLMYAANGPMYAISPASGRVVSQQRYTLAGMQAEGLRDTLALLAATAKEWRKTQLLDNPPVKTNGSAATRIQQRWSGQGQQ